MSINIRSIQHYMYCPRRFGLLEINGDWAENAFVAKANIMHEHVHDGSHEFSSKSKRVLSAVAVYNDDLDIYGITDCIEFEACPDGDKIEGRCCRVKIVEYKPTSPKNGEIRETDAIQVFAQKICVDYIWNCNSEGYIYYADTRKRVKLPFETQYERYYEHLTRLLAQMNKCIESDSIPMKQAGQNCSGCSLKDVCMPKIRKYSVKKLIFEGEGI